MTATPPIHPVMNYSDQPRPSLFRRRRRRRRRRGGMDKNVEDRRVFSRVLSSLLVSTGTTQLVMPRLDAALTRPSNSRSRSSSLAISQLTSVEKYTVYLSTSIIGESRLPNRFRTSFVTYSKVLES